MKIPDIFNKIKNKNVIVVGDTMLDSYIIGKVNRQSPEAPVPIVNVLKESKKLGGAANVIMNLKSLGLNPILCSVVGDDESGRNIIRLIEDNKLEMDGIVVEPRRKTTVKKRVIVKKNHVLRIDDEITEPINRNTRNLLINKIISFTNESDILIFQDYDKGLINKKLIDQVRSINNNIFIAVDPKFKNFNDYKDVDLFKPNLNEISYSLNIKKYSDKNLMNIGKGFINKNKIKNLMITLSERGIIIISDNEISQHKTSINKIVDVSGAGDTVLALSSILFYLKLSQKFIGEICNLAGGMTCMESGVIAINCKELIKNAERNNIDLYL